MMRKTVATLDQKVLSWIFETSSRKATYSTCNILGIHFHGEATNAITWSDVDSTGQLPILDGLSVFPQHDANILVTKARIISL